MSSRDPRLSGFLAQSEKNAKARDTKVLLLGALAVVAIMLNNRKRKA